MSEQNTEAELLKVANRAAIDLISTHNAGLSVRAIKTRLSRIADDLLYVASKSPPNKLRGFSVKRR